MTFIEILAAIKGAVGALRRTQQIVAAAAASGIVYMAGHYATLVEWKTRVELAIDEVQTWFGMTENLSVDFGAGYRLACYFAPVNEMIAIVGTLLGLAAMVLVVNTGLWVLALGRQIFTSDEDEE